MKPTSRILLLVAFLAASHAFAQDSARRVTDAVAPFVDEETIAIAHLDLERVEDVAPALAGLVRRTGVADNSEQAANDIAANVDQWLRQMQAAGAEHLFVVVSISDLPQGGPFLVASFGEGGNAVQIAHLLGHRPGTASRSSSPFPVVDYFGGRAVVAGPADSIERVKRRVRAGMNAEAPARLPVALNAVSEVPAQLVITPSEDHRRVIREMLPMLEWPLPGVSGELIADGLVWAAIGIDPNAPAVQIVVQSQDELAATRLARAIDQGLNIVAQRPELAQIVDHPAELLANLKPMQEANRLVWRLDAKTGHLNQIVERLLAPPIRAARSAAQRSERIRQFRQIAIAMHNYHDVNKTFPPQALKSEEGRPLLSWRVALLPYLEEGNLYRQFHLDEPWDSPHNRQLVEQMPAVFADPVLAELAAEGKTTFQVPLFADTVFPPAGQGIPIKEIKDGTSKTIMFVEVLPERAVPWTRPADWEVDPDDPLEGVQRTDRVSFTVAYCDGSVHTFAVDIDPQAFWRRLTRAGGEP